MHFGLKQDLFTSLFTREMAFDCNLPAELKEKFIPIGLIEPNGETLLVAENSDQLYCYYNPAFEIKTSEYSFTALLQREANLFISHYDQRPLNTRKKWHVQFLIKTNDENKLIECLGAKRKEWIYTETTASKVACFQTQLEIEWHTYTLKKQEYKDWDSPIYSPDIHEPLYALHTNSVIRNIEYNLKRFVLNYTLIDYGIK